MIEERINTELPVLIYRLNDYEKRLQGLETKVSNLSEGFIGVKTELAGVAKNEGKTSGAISGVATGIIIGVITYMIQSINKG